MIAAFRKLPLGKRYAYGFRTVIVSGLMLAFGSQVPDPEDKVLWLVVSVLAAAHWVITGVYCWFERRWYRFFLFAFSTVCTWFYIELSLNVWRPA